MTYRLDALDARKAWRAPRFTALVLAGSRPTGDPLARARGVSHKALVPVAGVPMLLRVVRTLDAACNVARVVVCGLDRRAVEKQEELRILAASGKISLIDGRPSPSASVLHAAQTLLGDGPLLVTTADHPLLTPEIVDYFCDQATRTGADVAVGLATADLVRSAFPGSRRTYVHFRDNAYCGCNLFGLLTPESYRAPAAWMRVEQHRKQPWRIVAALGPLTSLRFLLRRLTLDDAARLASHHMGVRVRRVLLPYPEAAVDGDAEDDLALLESILQRRAVSYAARPHPAASSPLPAVAPPAAPEASW